MTYYITGGAAVLATVAVVGAACADVVVEMPVKADARECKVNGGGYYGRFAVYDVGNEGFNWECVGK